MLNNEIKSAASAMQTLLVVDDIEANFFAIQQVLASLPVTLLFAKNGQEALDQMIAIKPDLVLLDDDMPGMDGYQVINQQQFHKEIRHIPVLLMTSNLFNEKQMLHQYLLDVVDTISKPLNQEALLGKLKVILEINRYRDIIKTIDSDEDNVLHSANEGILGIDETGLIRYANSASGYLLKIPPSKLVGIYVEALFEEAHHTVGSKWQNHPIRTVCERKTILQIDKTKFWRGDGTPLLVRFAAVPVNNLGNIKVVIAFRRLEQESEEKIKGLSGTDALTGLCTRKKFEEELDVIFTDKARIQSVALSILYLDLNHFKHINECLGHNTGDEVMKLVADRLRQLLRSGDALARSNGDEFIILLSDLTGKEDIFVVAEKICKAMQEAFLSGGHEIYLGCNIGVATYPRCGDSAAMLIKNAAFAAEQAKKTGRNTYCYFDPKLNEKLSERIKLTAQLRHAIEKESLLLDKQPIKLLESSSEEEALVGFYITPYWAQSNIDSMPFSKLFELAFKNDLLSVVWEWTLKKVFVEIKSHNKNNDRKLKWIMPVTRDLIHCGCLITHVALLEQIILQADCLLAFEESAFFARPKPLQALKQLAQNKGFSFALWQFGGEFGSLAVLENMPISVVYLADHFMTLTSLSDEKSMISFYVEAAKHFGIELWGKKSDHAAQVRPLLQHLGIKAIMG